MLLKRIHYKSHHEQKTYPFDLPWLSNLDTFEFTSPVTIFVGENGCGKSTLLESLALNSEAITITGSMLDNDLAYSSVSKLADALKLDWHYRTKSGFFFRADDFISFIRETRKRKTEAKEALEKINRKDPTSYERLPYLHTLSDLNQLYGEGLEHLSHGQSFLKLFQARLRPDSLYLLDEPETPLTPQNQLALLYLINEQVKKGSQFIISTHSPILMAYPEAEILDLSGKQITSIEYDEIEHVKFMKDFMSDPERYMYYTLRE